MLFADPSRKTAEFASGIQNKICFWLDTIKMCALCQVQTVTPTLTPLCFLGARGGFAFLLVRLAIKVEVVRVTVFWITRLTSRPTQGMMKSKLLEHFVNRLIMLLLKKNNTDALKVGLRAEHWLALAQWGQRTHSHLLHQPVLQGPASEGALGRGWVWAHGLSPA